MLVKDRLEKSIKRFIGWHQNFGDLSHDRMDFWGSSLGILAKKLFYINKLLGAPFALIGMLLETYFPRIQKLFATPHREVIGDAHMAMAYMDYFEKTQNQEYLKKAESLLNEMLSYSSKGYSGLCWGYSFGWETGNGFWEKGTPMITITPYAFWAFVQHFKLTGNMSSKANAISIADFTLKDLNEKAMPNGTYSSSYSPVTEDIIINANTYRAAVLMGAYELTSNEEYLLQANRCIEFTLSYQGERGEWYYEAKPPKNNFIDNFHTCFVLRNLYKCYQVNKDPILLEAIKKGYVYYRKELFDDRGFPKHFAVAKYFKMRKYEMYDFAEGINLGCLLKDDIPGSFDFAQTLAEKLLANFQTEEGYYLTRVATFNVKHKVPYLRWPQAQLFHSLTTMLKLQ